MIHKILVALPVSLLAMTAFAGSCGQSTNIYSNISKVNSKAATFSTASNTKSNTYTVKIGGTTYSNIKPGVTTKVSDTLSYNFTSKANNGDANLGGSTNKNIFFTLGAHGDSLNITIDKIGNKNKNYISQSYNCDIKSKT